MKPEAAVFEAKYHPFPEEKPAAGPRISVIIPALNEERAIGSVLAEIPRSLVDEVIVVDNGSSDRTADIARAAGVRVVREERRGYGAACLAGIAALAETDIVVFRYGDHSDYPEQISRLVGPIIAGEADFVIGSRARGRREPGALPIQSRFGNWLASQLIRLLFGARYSDLGPFRAISRTALKRLDMRDAGFGWTVEMQVKAAKKRLRVREVPVNYRRRIGKSKISGTLGGAVSAGAKIIHTILKLRLARY